MAENLAEAYNALKLKDADYSKLNNQIIAATHPVLTLTSLQVITRLSHSTWQSPR